MKNVCTKLKWLISIILLTNQMILANCLCESDSLKPYKMLNGYFYPNSHIENQLNLIIQGISAKKQNRLDSIIIYRLEKDNSDLVTINTKKDFRIVDLRTDSIVSRKELLMIKDFQKTVIIPFYDKKTKEIGKKSFITGFLVALSVTFVSLYFNK